MVYDTMKPYWHRFEACGRVEGAAAQLAKGGARGCKENCSGGTMEAHLNGQLAGLMGP